MTETKDADIHSAKNDTSAEWEDAAAMQQRLETLGEAITNTNDPEEKEDLNLDEECLMILLTNNGQTDLSGKRTNYQNEYDNDGMNKFTRSNYLGELKQKQPKPDQKQVKVWQYNDVKCDFVHTLIGSGSFDWPPLLKMIAKCSLYLSQVHRLIILCDTSQLEPAEKLMKPPTEVTFSHAMKIT